MTSETMREAYSRLLACHRRIRQEFSKLDNGSLERFFGGVNSEALSQLVRAHGDG